MDELLQAKRRNQLIMRKMPGHIASMVRNVIRMQSSGFNTRKYAVVRPGDGMGKTSERPIL